MRVLVTGGGSGIGAAVVTALTARGWEPITADLRPPADGVTLDVTDENGWEAVVGSHWPLNGVVNCAGTRTRASLHEMSLDVFEEAMRVHVRGCFLGMRAAISRWLETGTSGAIVNVSSVAATQAVAGQAHYVAAKGAINAMTRAAAVEYASAGIRVNAVAPGTVDTPMVADRIADPAAAAQWVARIPQGRPAQPAEVAAAIVFLLSEAASYCTGTVLAVDGGWSAS